MTRTAKFIWLSLAIFLWTDVAVAQTAVDNTANLLEQNQSAASIAEAVEQAVLYLQNKVDIKNADPKYKPVIAASKKITVAVELALWQKTTGKILYVSGRKSSKSVTLDNNQDYQIKVLADNGVNSRYQVTGAPPAYVIAVIHPIFRNIGTDKKPKFKLEDVVYVPYHDYLRTAEIIKTGKTIFDNKIAAVYDELNNLGVRSHAVPSQPITAMVDPTVVKSIIAIEHVSSSNLLNGNLTDYLNKFYTILATNKHSSYAYAGSAAAALGIAQFIPSTYQRLVKNRPELVLNPNFAQGMTDPYNAIKAQIGLLDTIFSELPSDIKSSVSRDRQRLGAYLAAIYNGGSRRVVKAIRQWDELWASDPATIKDRYQSEIKQLSATIAQIKKSLNSKQITQAEKIKLQSDLKKTNLELAAARQASKLANTAILKKETINYVAKYNLIYRHLSQTSEENLVIASK